MDEVKLTGMSGWEVNVVKDLENQSIHVAYSFRGCENDYSWSCAGAGVTVELS